MHCPVCDSPATEGFLRRDGVPVHQNLLCRSRDEARRVTRGRLEMRVCRGCGFVFNAAFELSLLSYSQDYENTQCHSPAFEAYMNGLVAHLVRERGMRSARIVEVGCGKGHFLRNLVEASPGNSGVGFDPAYDGPESSMEGRLRFERRFYDESCSDVPADLVVCRHVIEHVAHPLDVLRAVRGAVDAQAEALVCFETPDVEWILRGLVFWDFFYEHCSLFTPASLGTAFERAGFRVKTVRNVFGGQYQWLEAVPGAKATPSAPGRAGQIPELAAAYCRAEERLGTEWRRRLSELRARGPVALWGAGAKGATLAGLIDPDCALLDCVIDVNPGKQGAFIPGTGHPILPPQALGQRGVRHVVLTNPNYRAENEAMLRELQVDTVLVHWNPGEATQP